MWFKEDKDANRWYYRIYLEEDRFKDVNYNILVYADRWIFEGPDGRWTEPEMRVVLPCNLNYRETQEVMKAFQFAKDKMSEMCTEHSE